jgi:hypothetical protein
MAGSNLEQRQESEAKQQPMPGPATSAAITVASRPTFPPEPSRSPWKRRVGIAAGIGALGGLGWLLWWTLLRTPPRPYVLDLSPSASEYAVTNQATPLLNWQVSHPKQVESLIIRTFAPDGTQVGSAESYDLSGSLPVELLPYCTLANRKLTCQNFPTSVRQPGQYTFELTLLPDAALNLPPVQATSSLVTIVDIPEPTVVELVPQQVIYSEAGTPVSANTPNLAPPVTQAGVLLSWIVNNPKALQGLLLVVKDANGATLGGRRFVFGNPEASTESGLPEELEPFCQLTDKLVCQGVPTGMTQVGKYRFELTPVPVGLGDAPMPDPTATEVVEIQPRPVRIVSFTVNGQPAEPKYLIPVDQGDRIPGFRIGWQVEGGSTAKVELLPSPGSVGLQGMLPLPLSPADTTTVTLKVSDGQNPPIIRAVTFSTFDPTPNPTPVLVPQPTGMVPGGQGAPASAGVPSPTRPAAPQEPAPDPLGDRLRNLRNQSQDSEAQETEVEEAETQDSEVEGAEAQESAPQDTETEAGQLRDRTSDDMDLSF